MKRFVLTLPILLSLFFHNVVSAQKLDREIFKPISDTLQSHFKPSAVVVGKIAVDSVIRKKNTLLLYFSTPLSEYPYREYTVNSTYGIVSNMLPPEYKNCKIRIYSNGSLIEDFVPPIFKSREIEKSKRRHKREKKSEQTVSLIGKDSRPFTIDKGLQNKHLAIWQSHGYYYEQKLLRWEWQRARIFQTVEDLYTQSYVLPFLVPMLENAGAIVMLPRERDSQKNEVIVDNDTPSSGYSESSVNTNWSDSNLPGFKHTKESYLSGENPFTFGTARIISGLKKGDQSFAAWTPNIPESGEYAVYISYQTLPNSSDNAIYTVHHTGGLTKFRVNQKMGGGTWIYLGTFNFNKGSDPGNFVELSNSAVKKNEVITADAIKFGGGTGLIARKPAESGSELNRPSSSNEPIKMIIIPIDVQPVTSGYPKYAEGARYWLQWAGFSDTIYSPNKNANDYNDDYMSRGRWVNVLSGGSKNNPKEKGLNIPLDMAFAFHTDAGTTLNDSIIGTLGIYTRFSNGDDKFPNGESRFNNRYLTDIVQSQIVDDIRTTYEPIWQRRGIWDRSYSESRTPKVPAMLLELLSHQNFADMRYGLDPNFRFTVSRAVYKGFLKYLNYTQGTEYIVQPLPVKNMAASLDNGIVKLVWKEVIDSLEPTARPTKYVVYTRIDKGGFDNGRIVNGNMFSEEIERGKIYSYKVTAVNDGGESFPSEILSVYQAPVEKGKVLIVNGFDRLSAPSSYVTKDTTMGGFRDFLDHGVPYIKDFSYIGSQYEFRREIPWMDDDSPGFGASYAEYETRVIAGNTFDYPYVHGKAFANEGYSFVSCSRDAVTDLTVKLDDYKIVDIIMGKQIKTLVGRGIHPPKYEVFPKELQYSINAYTTNGGNIIVSGANVATDIWDSVNMDLESKQFAMQTLKYQWRTNYASKTGEVKSAPGPYPFEGKFSFYTTPNELSYCVETPDGIEPVGNDAWTIFRYADNNISAGVAYKGTYRSVVLGFPIEALKSNEEIESLIKMILKFFDNNAVN
ncbi:MAG: xanthan lyase [Rikenellaceae bacterium]